MKENMVTSTDQTQQSTLHDLTEFAIAKDVMVDFPRILAIYEKLLPALNHYQHYMGVATVIQTVSEAQILMKMQLSQFKQVYKNKGQIKDE